MKIRPLKNFCNDVNATISLSTCYISYLTITQMIITCNAIANIARAVITTNCVCACLSTTILIFSTFINICYVKLILSYYYYQRSQAYHHTFVYHLPSDIPIYMNTCSCQLCLYMSGYTDQCPRHIHQCQYSCAHH